MSFTEQQKREMELSRKDLDYARTIYQNAKAAFRNKTIDFQTYKNTKIIYRETQAKRSAFLQEMYRLGALQRRLSRLGVERILDAGKVRYVARDKDMVH